MEMLIRDFQFSDIDKLVEILKLNNQYSFPEVDGPEAMKRVSSCRSAIFLVGEVNNEVIGMVRGNYDGSRAIIHQLSVNPNYQKQGVGKVLVTEIIKRFRQMGAPTTSATTTEKNLPFWQKVGFKKINPTVFLVGNW
jgi:N-acetylglutamate synthase-like GNAT family acetyltransferase